MLDITVECDKMNFDKSMEVTWYWMVDKSLNRGTVSIDLEIDGFELTET